MGWMLPTRATLGVEAAPAITAPAIEAPGTIEALVRAVDETPVSDAPAPVVDELPAPSCVRCRATGLPDDMLLALVRMPDSMRERLELPAEAEWLCTGCLGTAHNLGLVSHDELFAAYGAPEDAQAWARAHTLVFPYASGSPAHAEQHALAEGLPLPSVPVIP